MQDLCDDDNTSEQSDANNLQDSIDSHDKSTSSPMESAQECWLSSDPAHQNALKQQSNEDDNEAQSDTKSSGSLENDDASLKQSELGESDTKPFESDDSSLKQGELAIGGEAQSDTKPSTGSLESDDSSLKENEPGGEATKLSGSLESDHDNTSLKQSRLEAGEPTAKKKRRSILDSMSKLVKKITPSKQKRKDSISKHEQTPADSSAVVDVGKVFIARYAYQARTTEDLSFEKGEQLIVSSLCLCHVACNKLY